LKNLKQAPSIKKAAVFATTVVMFFAALFVLSACSGDSPLIGRWDGASMEIEFLGETINEDLDSGLIVFEFLEDGTGLSSEFGDVDTFTWTTSNGQLTTVGADGLSETMDYSVSGSYLTLTVEEPGATIIMRLRRVD